MSLPHTSFLRKGILLSTLTAAFFQITHAATYYVDYENGSDLNDGLSKETPFKHSPGDSQATAKAAALNLAPGDTIRFKGGATYRGDISIRWSGEEGMPIVFDGNQDGSYGEGQAIIDGSEIISGWQRVDSQAQAKGNPHWKNLYYADISNAPEALSSNLMQDDRLMSLGRVPQAKGTFFPDELETMRQVTAPAIQTYLPVEINGWQPDGRPLTLNRNHPLHLLVDGSTRSLAIIDPMEQARLQLRTLGDKTVTAFTLTGGNRPAKAKGVEFRVGDEIVAQGILPENGNRTEFKTVRPVTFKELEVRIVSLHDGATANYGALTQVEALAPDGTDVLAIGDEAYSYYTDQLFFSQEKSEDWKDAYFSLWARPNRVVHIPVTAYEPSESRIRLERITVDQYPDDSGKFALINVLGGISRPGEYYITKGEQPGTARLFIWPHETTDEGPTGVSLSRRASGFQLSGVSHVTLQGFIIQKQGGVQSRAIHITGNSSDIHIRHNEIRFGQSRQRDATIAIASGQRIHIENNYIHHNRTNRGIRTTMTDSVVHANRLHQNGSTGIAFFRTSNSRMTNNTVTGHYGVHANSLTVYLGSDNILVEGNHASDGNIALTMQNSSNLTVINNFFRHNHGVVVALWAGTHHNIDIIHNTIIGAMDGEDWASGIFTNSKEIEGLNIHNNIIAGINGNLSGNFSHNIFTRLGKTQKETGLGLSDNSPLIPDINTLFVNASQGDFSLRPDSHAIDNGIDMQIRFDIRGNPRPTGSHPDIGAYEYATP